MSKGKKKIIHKIFGNTCKEIKGKKITEAWGVLISN